MKDWFIKEIRLTRDGQRFGPSKCQYPYHVIGHYSAECGDPSELFSWTLPNEFWLNDRYDLSGVTLDERESVCSSVF